LLININTLSQAIFCFRNCYFTMLQEGQLLQRSRAMVHVIAYFAKSLNVTQGH